MFHLGAFHESIDPAGVLVPITAVQDQVVTTQGDDMRVPKDLPFFLGAAAAIEATAPLQVQVTSPSLRRFTNIDVNPFSTGLVVGNGHQVMYAPYTPPMLVGDESLNFQINSNPVAATDQYGLVWFGDGPMAPVNGEIYTVRATMSVTGVVGTWVNGNITFEQDLPYGDYDVVGMRCVEATTVAARLVFVGGAYRPGTIGNSAVTAQDVDNLRMGRSGVWGTFNTNTPPTCDILAAAGAITPTLYLDLIAR